MISLKLIIVVFDVCPTEEKALVQSKVEWNFSFNIGMSFFHHTIILNKTGCNFVPKRTGGKKNNRNTDRMARIHSGSLQANSQRVQYASMFFLLFPMC